MQVGPRLRICGKAEYLVHKSVPRNFTPVCISKFFQICNVMLLQLASSVLNASIFKIQRFTHNMKSTGVT